MTASGESQPGRGPAVPSASATVAHQPVSGGGARLSAGLLHAWQQRNAEASLPLALRQLETAGNLANVRLAVSGAREGYRGPVFMDSDIYKVLEAIGWELGRSPDEGLASFLAETTLLLEKAQQPDGYLNSYMQVTGRPRYSFLASSHELYCAGHLIQAGIACQRGAGDPALLAVARRFADHLVDHFLDRQEGIDGHPIVESALAELYRETGHEPYLRLAGQFIEQRGHGLIGDSGFGSRYLQDHEPVRDTVTEVGHVVRALYLDTGVADVATETGDAALLQSSLTRWADMVAAKTYLTGGNGSRHEGESFGDRFELPPDRAYNETCAAIASFQWAWRLLLATGDAGYADLMERILYNGFASSTATDGTRFFYVNPLQRRADHFEKDDPGRRRKWFNCACCPPNIMRTMASLQHYLATVSAGTLYVQQFTCATLSAPLAGGVLTVEMATDYPWAGSVELRVTSAPPQACGLAVRVPAWSAVPQIRRNEDLVEADPERGYLVVRGQWRPGDVLRFELDTTPRLTYPDRRVEAVRGTAAIERGPLVYCVEQADQPAGTEVADLALAPGELEEVSATLPGVGSTILIRASAVHRPQPQQPGLPYHAAAGTAPASGAQASGDADGEPVTTTAIPYFQWDNRDGRPMQVWIPVANA
ncbi:MAG TPA: beta-L-arabinofuranosidase domain-containing protein [Streptosporangiaceae bacterium]